MLIKEVAIRRFPKDPLVSARSLHWGAVFAGCWVGVVVILRVKVVASVEVGKVRRNELPDEKKSCSSDFYGDLTQAPLVFMQ